MEFSIEDIANDENVQDFLNARGITKKTRKSHILKLKSYCNFIQQSPTELLEEAEYEEENGIKKKKRRIRKKIVGYVNHLKEKNKSTNTIKMYLTTVKAFYKDNDIKLPNIPRNICENKDLKLKNISSKEVPKKEHVRKACSITGIRNKAMILLHFSSGMGSSEVRHLTYEDYLTAVEDYINVDDSLDLFKVANQILKVNDCIGVWKIARYKKPIPYVTFSTTESIHAIAEYLLYRLHHNKPINNLDDFLFVNKFNGHITEFSYIKTFNRINDGCGFGKRKNGYHFFASHRLRVAFAHAAMENDLDSLDVKKLLGHNVGDTDKAYLGTTIKKHRKQYMKFINDVSLERLEVLEYGDKRVLEMEHKLEVMAKAQQKYNELFELFDDPEVENAIIRARARKIMENK